MGNPRHVQKAIRTRNNKHGIKDIERAKEIKKIAKNKRKQSNRIEFIKQRTKSGIESEAETETDTENRWNRWHKSQRKVGNDDKIKWSCCLSWSWQMFLSDRNRLRINWSWNCSWSTQVSMNYLSSFSIVDIYIIWYDGTKAFRLLDRKCIKGLSAVFIR